MKNKVLFTLFALLGCCNMLKAADCANGKSGYIVPSSITDLDNDGVPDNGSTLEICYYVASWTPNASDDWFHAVEVDLPLTGYNLASVVPTVVPDATFYGYDDDGLCPSRRLNSVVV